MNDCIGLIVRTCQLDDGSGCKNYKCLSGSWNSLLMGYIVILKWMNYAF